MDIYESIEVLPLQVFILPILADDSDQYISFL